MVRITSSKTDKKKYLKILYWGPHLAGKTTILETLLHLTKDSNKDFVPVRNITKIEQANGATLYFDKVIFRDFQPTKEGNIFYYVYTVAGTKEFKLLRRKIFRGTDGIIFVFDSQRSRLNENIESLKELIKVSKDNLIKYIPLIVMINKQDLSDIVNISDVIQILKDQGLMFEPEDPQYVWNPVIFDTIGIYEKEKNVYQAFMECVNRTKLYLEEKKTIKTARINLVLPEEDKNEWELFAKETLNTSLSQMIRDAVREYQGKFQNFQPKSGGIEIDLEIQVEKIVQKKMDEILKQLKFPASKED